MHCPKCGKENPDDAQLCNSCGSALMQAPVARKRPDVKTSELAVISCILGIFSLFTFYLEAMLESVPLGFIHIGGTTLALLLGIISLIRIELSAGRLAGRGFAVIAIIIPAALLCLRLLTPVLRSPRFVAHRITCSSNLSRIGRAILIYGPGDYDDPLPRAGGKSTTWQPKINNWQADSRQDAFGMNRTDSSGGHATISSSLYLLVKYVELVPRFFVCPQDSGTTEFNHTEYGLQGKDLINLWDFGPKPQKHCSYSYHLPYGPYALTMSSEPGMAIAADRNPWMHTPTIKAKDFSFFKYYGDMQQKKVGNAITHNGEGQNVLFLDGHVNFQKLPFCGIDNDNIYTYWNELDIWGGIPPMLDSQPANRLDSLLVHDPPTADKK